MRRFLQPYQQLLQQPGVARLFMVAALTRMPISMTALALTLYLRSTLGNFAQAGTVVGAYFVAMALMAPVLGRVIDRIGPRWPLLVTGWLQPLLLLLLYVAADQHREFALVPTCGVLAGLLPPPLTILTRTLWRHRFSLESERRIAYALDSVITELNFTVGPAQVGFMVAFSNAHVALAVAILCNFLAFLLFHYSRSLAHWQQDAGGERHWLGPLTDGRLVVTFCLAFGLTFCFGLIEVSYPAYALHYNSPALAGILIALGCLGSALGGALYGTWRSHWSLERQFALALSVMVGVPFILHALLQQLPLFIVVAFIGGLGVAPALTTITLLTTQRAPALYATEALTWSATFIVSGFGAGMGAAGYFIETWSLTITFWLGAMIMTGMALCAWLMQYTGSEPMALNNSEPHG